MYFMEILIRPGFDESQRIRAAELFWQAFRGKLGKLMGPDDRAIHFFAQSLDPNFVFTAQDSSGCLLGMAGFKTSDGTFADGTFDDLRQVYGTWGAIWRALTLSIFERPVAPDVLLMDAICVSADARGLGVGTRLLDRIKEEARQRGLTQVRLDVIDTNPRAQALYEREGFKAGPVQSAWPLRRVLGFNQSTTMIWRG